MHGRQLCRHGKERRRAGRRETGPAAVTRWRWPRSLRRRPGRPPLPAGAGRARGAGDRAGRRYPRALAALAAQETGPAVATRGRCCEAGPAARVWLGRARLAGELPALPAGSCAGRRVLAAAYADQLKLFKFTMNARNVFNCSCAMLRYSARC